jgi:hypothetical protein
MMAHIFYILFHQYLKNAQVRFETAQPAGDSNPNGQKYSFGPYPPQWQKF